jgi:hypothetical protein
MISTLSLGYLIFFSFMYEPFRIKHKDCNFWVWVSPGVGSLGSQGFQLTLFGATGLLVMELPGKK